MNKILKYLGYFVAFIIFVLIFLKVLEKVGFGCFYDCEEYIDMRGKKIDYISDKTFVNGKQVK